MQLSADSIICVSSRREAEEAASGKENCSRG